MELFDACDAHGNLLGIDLVRGMPHADGLFHRVIEVMIVNEEKQILITQRAAEKNFAFQWEITGGSVIKGESIKEGAIREVEEETGIILHEKQLEPLYIASYMDSIYYCFIAHTDFNASMIHLQKGETIDYKLVNLRDFWKMIEDRLFPPTLALRLQQYRERIELNVLK